MKVYIVIPYLTNNDIDNDNLKVFSKQDTAIQYAVNMRFIAYDIIMDELDSWEDEGPEYDSAGFTEDDRIINGQYKCD